MRRTLCLLTAVLAAMVTATGAADARLLRDGKKMISCPDPTVLDAHVGHYRYYLACTSDAAGDVFPLRGSNDLVHFTQIGYVFDKRHQPWWALHTPKAGHYWAPALYRLDNRWVLYFAAQHNPRRLRLTYPGGGTVPGSNMMIGVATATSLHGPWKTRVLHYRGQFNAIAHEHETYGGVIDPSLVADPVTGQLYLFWAEQHSSIWATELSSDGLTISPQIHQVMWTRPGWECRTPRHTCVIEGPEEYYHDGWFYLFYSGASTWTGSYAIGVAASQDPMVGQFQRLDDQPALRSGHGYVGPGGSSAPVTGPDLRSYIFYHAMTHPNAHHISADRYLFSSPLRWQGLGGYDPVIGSGLVDIRAALATAPVDVSP